MKILITGNLGYVGPELVKEFRNYHPEATLIGFDAGFFANDLTRKAEDIVSDVDEQVFGDVRDFPESLLEGVDTVVSLAAISNDPIGNRFEQVTLDINCEANIQIAKMAKKAGVSSFVFASSCSVYGSAESAPRSEDSPLNPLTAYAKSKINSELGLEGLADDSFQITCLRFATACGMSDRLRLDLVLNDFVAGAVASKEITILSDGSPWRPLINVADMGRAIRWAHERSNENGGTFAVVNAGTEGWNYQVKDLAYAIQEILPEVKISINTNAAPDKRSYRVSFAKFAELAPDHQPLHDLNSSIQGLIDGLKAIDFQDKEFHKSRLIRLNVIQELRNTGALNDQLRLVDVSNSQMA